LTIRDFQKYRTKPDSKDASVPQPMPSDQRDRSRDDRLASEAVAALAALAHPGRLEVFRLLVQAGPDGLAAGEIARATGSLPNTLSTNLGVLAAAGLAASRRDGRRIIYTAGYERMRDLLAFLMEDCCGGRPEVCAPLLEAVGRVCGSQAAAC
jgi:DNA-binding transcriptional ArsR family regulator